MALARATWRGVSSDVHQGIKQAAIETLEHRMMLCADHAVPSAAAWGYEPLVDSDLLTAAQPSRTTTTTSAANADGGAAIAPPPLIVPALSSRPGAAKTIYLDFDGDIHRRWGSWLGIGGTDTLGPIPAYDIDGDTASFSSQEMLNITEVWKIVSEKFSVFDLNITTIDPGHISDNVTAKVVIGGDGMWYGSGGGVAYVGGFYNDNESVAYVWGGPDNVDYMGEAAAHEAGHMLGLYHQTLYGAGGRLVQEYRSGYIMGGGGRWGVGTASRNPGGDGVRYIGMQDDLDVLRNGGARLPLRPDDHGNSVASARALSPIFGVYASSGVITTTTDVDVFRITVPAPGHVRINANVPERGAMLNLNLRLLRPDGLPTGIATTSSYSEELLIPVIVPGTYYVEVASSGEVGSIGQYTLTADVTGPEDNSLPAATRLGRFGQVTDDNSAVFEGQGHRSGVVSAADPEDFYVLDARPGRFTAELINLSGDAHLELIQDWNVNGRVDPGEVVAASRNLGTANERVVRPGSLARVYLRVTTPSESGVNYTLRVRLDRAGQLPPSGDPPVAPLYIYSFQFDHGSVTRHDYVGLSDNADWYEVVHSGAHNRLSVLVDQNAQDVALDIAQDGNGDGLISPGEVLASSNRGGGATPERIENFPLTPRERYFVRVNSVNAAEANYRIQMIPETALVKSLVDLTEARPFADLFPSIYAGRVTDFVGTLDAVDTYRIPTIPGPLHVGLVPGAPPHFLELVVDINENQQIEQNEVILSSDDPGKPLSIDVPEQFKSPMYIRVRPNSLPNNTFTSGDYTLFFRTAYAASPAGTTPKDARELSLNGQLARGYVGFDPQGLLTRLQDIHRFSVDQKTARFTASLKLSNPAAAVSLQLYRDDDQDGLLDPDERVAGRNGPALDTNLAPGTYFLVVNAASGGHAGHGGDAAMTTDYELQYAVTAPIDLQAPKVTGAQFSLDQRPHGLAMQFSEHVGDSLDLDDVTIDVVIGKDKPRLLELVYDAKTRTAGLVFDGLTPDGRYKLHIPAAKVTDRAGNPLAEDFTFEFFFLVGDANFDGKVNADDYFRIDSAFIAQPQNPTYAQGDFNYDGKINADDYFQIDSSFLRQGPPLSTTAVFSTTTGSTDAASATLFSAEPQRRPDKKRLERVTFSDEPIATTRQSARRRASAR